EALEARGEECQPLLRRELLDRPLVELASLWRQGDDTMVGHPTVGRVERRGDDVHAQDHPGTAPVGLVVDLAGPQRRRVPVVEEAQLELCAEDAGERTL